MICVCQHIVELEGDEALEYADDHLRLIYVDPELRRFHYECPITHITWLKHYPEGEYHGRGTPHLSRLPANTDG